MKEVYSVKEAINKIENFCAYQERCHEEVVQKIRNKKMNSDESDSITIHLKSDNFLDEERFVCIFTNGKQLIIHWRRLGL